MLKYYLPEATQDSFIWLPLEDQVPLDDVNHFMPVWEYIVRDTHTFLLNWSLCLVAWYHATDFNTISLVDASILCILGTLKYSGIWKLRPHTVKTREIVIPMWHYLWAIYSIGVQPLWSCRRSLMTRFHYAGLMSYGYRSYGLTTVIPI